MWDFGTPGRKYQPNLFICHLKPGSVSFAGNARHQARSRIVILQALDNAVDSVKEALPKGSSWIFDSLTMWFNTFYFLNQRIEISTFISIFEKFECRF
jgi:hypothetical protein